jgi:hypothetical protein
VVCYGRTRRVTSKRERERERDDKDDGIRRRLTADTTEHVDGNQPVVVVVVVGVVVVVVVGVEVVFCRYVTLGSLSTEADAAAPSTRSTRMQGIRALLCRCSDERSNDASVNQHDRLLKRSE